jgi:hypothetical protein
MGNRRFSPSRRGAVATATICRRLDGIPLAIELAAARSAALGTAEVASRLDDRFRLLTDGLRTALPRHQTLRATLDWSYELLPEPERVVLRRLAIFVGSIVLAAASAVAASDAITPSQVVDSVAQLIMKSLVMADRNNAVVHYRLLETTRAYALEKLVESGEANAVARRHADYYREFLQRVETGAEPDTKTAGDQVAALVAAKSTIPPTCRARPTSLTPEPSTLGPRRPERLSHRQSGSAAFAAASLTPLRAALCLKARRDEGMVLFRSNKGIALDLKFNRARLPCPIC